MKHFQPWSPLKGYSYPHEPKKEPPYVNPYPSTVPRVGDWMQTHSGKQFWPLDPRPEDFEIDDIAHALSMLCRFGGHCRTFYSVAEHSVLMSEQASAPNKLWALLHDAPEAYLVDVPRPIKRYLGGYEKIERGLMGAICVRWDLQRAGDEPVMPEEIKILDNRILLTEQKALMAPPPAPWNVPGEPLDVEITGVQPHVARAWFLDQFQELTWKAKAA